MLKLIIWKLSAICFTKFYGVSLVPKLTRALNVYSSEFQVFASVNFFCALNFSSRERKFNNCERRDWHTLSRKLGLLARIYHTLSRKLYLLARKYDFWQCARAGTKEGRALLWLVLIVEGLTESRSHVTHFNQTPVSSYICVWWKLIFNDEPK